MNNKKIMKELKINEKELKAIKKALENIGIEPNEENILECYNNNTITINIGRNNTTYAWAIWNETKESCINIQTLEELDKEEIEKLFC